jgi:hypothetical protein
MQILMVVKMCGSPVTHLEALLLDMTSNVQNKSFLQLFEQTLPFT